MSNSRFNIRFEKNEIDFSKSRLDFLRRLRDRLFAQVKEDAIKLTNKIEEIVIDRALAKSLNKPQSYKAYQEHEKQRIKWEMNVRKFRAMQNKIREHIYFARQQKRIKKQELLPSIDQKVKKVQVTKNGCFFSGKQLAHTRLPSIHEHKLIYSYCNKA